MKKFNSNLNNNESELFLSKRFFEYSNDMLCIVGFDGYFKLLNPAWTKTLGWSSEELLSKPWNEFVHPDDILDTENAKSEIIDGKEVYQFENRYRCKNGDYKWLSWNSYPHPEDEIMYGVARDVTKKRIQEQKIRDQEQLISDMGKMAQVGGWEFDPITGEGSWTEETAKIHDLNPDHKTTSDFGLSFYKPKSKKKIEKAIQDAIHLHKSYRLELQLVSAKGIEKWVETIGKPIIEDGKVIKIRGSFQDITKRKNDERLLRLSMNRLKHSHHLMKYVIEHIGGSVAVHDKDLNYVYVSQRYLDDFNVTDKEIIGKHHYEVFPDIPQKLKDVYQSALKGTVQKKDEDLYLRADGTVHWTRWECRPWYDMNGEIGGIIRYNEVITDQKLAELELKKLSTAIEQSPNSIIITNIDGIIEYVNPAFENLTGYSNKEAIGQKPNILKSGEQSAEFYKHLWVTISSGNIWKGDLLNKKKNGELYWESANISPVFDDHGNIMNYLAVKEDITQRKADEEQIKKSELYHRSLLQSIPDLVFVLDDNGILLDYKASNEEDLFFTPAKFLNKNIRALMPAKVVQKIMAATDECLDKKLNVPFEFSLEVKNHTQFYNANMVAFGENRVIAIVRNMTEYKNNLDKIQTLLDIEEKQSESLRTFTQIVSHNLRIHSANMLGILMLLEMEDSETFENQFVQLLKESSKNLEETIGHLNEVLEIKLDSKINFEKINLRNVVNRAISGLKLFADNNNVDLINDVSEEFYLDAVSSYLDSIIIKLLDNGIRFSDDEKDSYVHIYSEIDHGNKVIIVQDNGLGLDLELYGEQLFDFYKKFHDKSTSKGLGLFMTKNQVEAMGGHIEVESELTEGTTFKVYLPNENKNERDKRNMPN